jgi:hypothetical protein
MMQVVNWITLGHKEIEHLSFRTESGRKKKQIGKSKR